MKDGHVIIFVMFEAKLELLGGHSVIYGKLQQSTLYGWNCWNNSLPILTAKTSLKYSGLEKTDLQLRNVGCMEHKTG